MSSREYPHRPIVGLGVVIIGSPGVVLIKRGKPPRAGSWSLPGGAQKTGETVAQGLAREAREETGLDVEVLQMIDVVDSINKDASGDIKYHYTLVDALARVTGGDLAAGSDASDAGWFQKSELEELDLWAETRRIINHGFYLFETRYK